MRHTFTGAGTGAMETIEKTRGMKVGELAKRTGLSVRTLHYYDEIGLLPPSRHTRSRHRLYGVPELLRLQQIKSMRQLGFSLDEIRALLQQRELSPHRVLELHVRRLREQIEGQRRLCALLESLAASISSRATVSADELILAIEGITRMEKYYTPEQIRDIKERGAKLGEAHIKAVEAEWPRLIAQVREEMQKGTDPTSERVRALAKRWKELVEEFTGGDPGIVDALRRMYAQEPTVRERTGIDAAMGEYIGRAMRAG